MGKLLLSSWICLGILLIDKLRISIDKRKKEDLSKDNQTLKCSLQMMSSLLLHISNRSVVLCLDEYAINSTMSYLLTFSLFVNIAEIHYIRSNLLFNIMHKKMTDQCFMVITN